MTSENLNRANEISKLIHDINNKLEALNHREFPNYGVDIGDGWNGVIRIDKSIIDASIINTVVTLVRSALETKKQALEKELESL
jgi:hypothetical protein